MVFTSLAFAVFLPVVFCLYWFVFGRSRRGQNLLLLAASYVFYGWWNWKYLMLIAFTSFCSWAAGLLILRFRGKGKKALAVNVLNIVANLGILCIFKYHDFFVSSFADAFLGGDRHGLLLNVLLPVGISFYTFQAIGYVIDVYRGKVQPTRDIIQYFAYISFFPQLVAGPIERAGHLLPQFGQDRKFAYGTAADGLRQMLWGFFKKVVVANECAKYVDYVFAHAAALPGYTLLFGAIFFTFQIYSDFSGYSDIAIGCAKLFGFRLMQNFRVPFLSHDIAEFWRRWHISLTTWFRDYVYIPLGGSRCNKVKILRNTFIVFLLSGLWHGANWTYIAWGGYNALLFVPRILSGKKRRYPRSAAAGRVRIILTFLLVSAGFILFRSESIPAAWQYAKGIFSLGLGSIGLYWHKYLTVRQVVMIVSAIAVMSVAEYRNRDCEHGLYLGSVHSRALRWAIYIVISIVVCLCFDSGANPFIYFQF